MCKQRRAKYYEKGYVLVGAGQIGMENAENNDQDYKNGSYALAGGVAAPLPEDAPQFAVCR